jgi:hypothetical protein
LEEQGPKKGWTTDHSGRGLCLEPWTLRVDEWEESLHDFALDAVDAAALDVSARHVLFRGAFAPVRADANLPVVSASLSLVSRVLELLGLG